MRTLIDIKQEIDRLSNRRSEVMRALSQGFDVTLKSEHLELEEQIAQLWDEQRNARALLRNGDGKKNDRAFRAFVVGPIKGHLRGFPWGLHLHRCSVDRCHADVSGLVAGRQPFAAGMNRNEPGCLR